MRKFRFADSMRLSTQFIILSCVVVTIVVVLGNGAFLLWEKKNMSQDLERKGKTISSFVAQLAADPFLYKDILKLDNIAGAAIKEKDVVYAFFLDAGDRPITSLMGSVNFEDALVKDIIKQDEDPATALGLFKNNRDILSIKTPVSDGTAVVGSLVLGLSMVNTHNQFSLLVIYNVFFGIGVLFCLSVSIFLMFRYAVARPIQRIIDSAEKIAAGELRDTVDIRGSSEITALSRAINTISVSLKEMIFNAISVTGTVSTVTSAIAASSRKVLDRTDVQKEAIIKTAAAVSGMNASTADLSAAAGSLSATSEETSAAIMQMSASIHGIAEKSTMSYDAAQDTAASVEEMSATIKTISDNLNNLSASSLETSSALSEINISVKEVEKHADTSVVLAEKVEQEASGTGMNAINMALNGMAEIRETVSAASEVINRLLESAHSIGKILNVIDDVADQTNLLAINAAILASKAGAHGKGFSVVAAAIKELAERTAFSTTEISNLIAAVQKETKSSVEMTARGLRAVEKGVVLFNNVKDGLANIIADSQTSTEMARMINKAASEEALAIKQITDATNGIMEQINHIAEATGEQSRGSRLILEAAEKMKDVSSLIQTATKEQSLGSRQITEAMENVNSQAVQIAEATTNQRDRSEVIGEAMKDIGKATDELIGSSVEMDRQIGALTNEAEKLLSSLQKFRV